MDGPFAVNCVRKYWRHVVLVATPLILLPLPVIVADDKALCGYMLLLMVVFWVTEALPLGVTGLIPLFLAPMLSLISLDDVARSYMKPNALYFLGSVVVALAVERSDLHRRIALRVLLLVGCKIQWLLLILMSVTSLLSCLVVNSAAVAVVFPVLQALLEQLDPSECQQTPGQSVRSNQDTTGQSVRSNQDTTGIADNAECRTVNDMSDRSTCQGNGETYELGALPQPTDSGDVQGVDNPGFTDDERVFQRDLGPVRDEPLTRSSTPSDVDGEKRRRSYGKLATALTLSLPLAANVGGIATLTGSSTNVIMKQSVDDYYAARGHASPITYVTWMAYSAPVAAIILAVLWLWLLVLYRECKPSILKVTARQLRQRYRNLGAMTYYEWMTLLHVTSLVVLMFFCEPDFMTGWGQRFKAGYIDAAVPAIIVSLSLFIFPSQMPSKKVIELPGLPDTLITWSAVKQRVPWDIMLILGGGHALADVIQETDLAAWFGDQLVQLEHWPDVAMVIVICLVATLLTEVISNPAVCLVLMPVATHLAERFDKNPLYFTLPVCLSASLAFMLPVANPSNALVFTSRRVRTIDMIKAGFLANLIGILVVTLANMTWGMTYFDLNTVPWETENATMTTPTETHPLVVSVQFLETE